MAKEIAAMVILAALIVGAFVNVRLANGLTSELTDAVNSVERDDDAERALEIWLNARGYTHTILRHTEIDAVTEDFYALLYALRANGDVETAKQRLIWRLNSIREMEKLSVGTVF
ncbi:MAG: DUF4363 family protein [Oscillospiraceae bacterium]|jgi:hypothetical protein|nr:DUF4363 family protein [Oscillospiraceae bacterium]